MFVQNISTAINPPIIKAYAQGDKQRMFSLLFNGMKYTFFLAFCLIVPMLFETHFVLSLWLEEVPEYTVEFVQYVLLVIGIELFSHITATTIQATGKIKWYQIIVGSILFLNLPISYVVMRLTNSPMSPMYVAVALSIVSMIFRFWLLYRLIHFPLSQLFTLFRLTMILLIFSLPSIYFIQSELCEGISRFFIILFSTLFFSGSVLILFGISKEEHLKIRSYTSDKIKIYAKRFKQRY